MVSQWFLQAAAKMNGQYHNNAGDEIDLTLKLGLPNSTDSAKMTPHHANMDINTLYSLQGINRYKLWNGGMNMANVEQGFNLNGVAWPPSKLMGSQSQYAQYMHNGYGINPAAPLPIYHPHYNINPNHHLQPAAGGRMMKDYILLDIPSRRADRGLGVASSAGRRGAAGKRRSGVGTFIDPFKRCTNYNCHTYETPMWRKGPLGPKSLCNACGIKYRKGEDKRMKAKEAAERASRQNRNAGSASKILMEGPN